MVSRRRSTAVLSFMLALGLGFAGTAVPAAQATPLPASATSGSVTITGASASTNAPNPNSCAASGTSQKYQTITFHTNSVGNAALAVTINASAPVTATLYQGAFLPGSPGVNCYITAADVNGSLTMNTAYNNSSLPDFPSQTWVVVLSSSTPGPGITANATMASSLGTVTVDSITPQVTATGLADGQAGADYYDYVDATGGTAPYTFSATGLPAGLQIGDDGTVEGTPTQAGRFNVQVTAVDASTPARTSAAVTIPLTIAAPVLALAPSTATPLNATYGASFSQTFTATGGTAPYSWTVTGPLPAGLSFNSSTGVLSGVPTIQAASYVFTVSATDSSTGDGAPVSVQGNYSLNIPAAMVGLSPVTVPGGAVAAPYTATTLSASGGIAPYSYAVTAGALPPGLTLSAAGAMAGTPTGSGNYNFTVMATDANGQTGARAYSMPISAASVTVTPASLPGAAALQAYDEQLSASGGTSPYTFAVTSGSLPAGISLSMGGRLSGTPTAAGSFSFTVAATDASTGGGPFTSMRNYTLLVAAPAITISPGTLPEAVTGTAFSQTLGAAGGTTPYSYAVTAGFLPAGVSLSAAGELSGTPTAAGTFAFTIRATDTNGFTASRGYTLDVVPPTIALGPATLGQSTLRESYSQQLSASGGTAGYSYKLTSGALPAGMTLSNDGLLSGTPTQHGDFDFAVTATDSTTGTGPFAGTRQYSLSVAVRAIVLTPATLPSGMDGSAYNQQLGATGGDGTFTFSISAGTLPRGLTLSGSGLLSGTPSEPASATFTVVATDDLGFRGDHSYQLDIAAAPLVLVPETVPDRKPGDPFALELTMDGGVGPFSYAVTKGTLPAGMILDPVSGTISGTPTAVGTYRFTVAITDSSPTPVTASAEYTIEVPSQPLSISIPGAQPGSPPGELPKAKAGTPFSVTLQGSGGAGPYTFALKPTGGMGMAVPMAMTGMPMGLTLSRNGVISGTPLTSGDFSFDVLVTDKYGSTSTSAVQLSIAAASTPTTPATPTPSATPAPSSTPSSVPTATPSAAVHPTATSTEKSDAVPSATPDPKVLAETGAATATRWLVVGAFALILAGVGMTVLRRRRQH